MNLISTFNRYEIVLNRIKIISKLYKIYSKKYLENVFKLIAFVNFEEQRRKDYKINIMQQSMKWTSAYHKKLRYKSNWTKPEMLLEKQTNTYVIDMLTTKIHSLYDIDIRFRRRHYGIKRTYYARKKRCSKRESASWGGNCKLSVQDFALTYSFTLPGHDY